MKKKVVIALSGGVDSSGAAVLLQEKGYDVFGIMLKLFPEQAEFGGKQAFVDAQRVADILNIPFRIFDFSEIFQKEVINYFAKSYLQGLTPNPCVMCNQRIKFNELLIKTLDLGADLLATGHYVIKGFNKQNNRYTLGRAEDIHKDQSYVLFGLTQEQLAYTIFPNGDYKKEEIRKIIKSRGIPIFDKEESQEICFIPDNDYGRFLREYSQNSFQPGNIIDKKGTVLGIHNGVAFYTIGQRKGLGIAAPEPYYVIDISPENNLIVVGKAEEVYSDQFLVNDLNWVSINPPNISTEALVKIRYTASAIKCIIIPENSGIRVRLNEPQRAITPGQAAVFYRESLVLGGGFITKWNPE